MEKLDLLVATGSRFSVDGTGQPLRSSHDPGISRSAHPGRIRGKFLDTESILLEYPFLLECMIGRMEIDENVIILPYQAEFGNCSSKHIGPYEARTLSLKRIESVYRMDAAKLTSLASATGGSKYDFLDV